MRSKMSTTGDRLSEPATVMASRPLSEGRAMRSAASRPASQPEFSKRFKLSDTRGQGTWQQDHSPRPSESRCGEARRKEGSHLQDGASTPLRGSFAGAAGFLSRAGVTSSGPWRPASSAAIHATGSPVCAAAAHSTATRSRWSGCCRPRSLHGDGSMGEGSRRRD